MGRSDQVGYFSFFWCKEHDAKGRGRENTRKAVVVSSYYAFKDVVGTTWTMRKVVQERSRVRIVG